MRLNGKFSNGHNCLGKLLSLLAEILWSRTAVLGKNDGDEVESELSDAFLSHLHCCFHWLPQAATSSCGEDLWKQWSGTCSRRSKPLGNTGKYQLLPVVAQSVGSRVSVAFSNGVSPSCRLRRDPFLTLQSSSKKRYAFTWNGSPLETCCLQLVRRSETGASRKISDYTFNLNYITT